MSKFYISTDKSAPSQSIAITNNQLKNLYIQIESIVRYFKTRLLDNTVAEGIQNRICKLNKVEHINQLTQNQYNNTIHHLQNIEHVMHQYFCCISLIEDSLFNSLLARGIDNTNILYNPHKIYAGSNRLTRAKKLAKELINIRILKELY
ncbi:MAG: hypothetical protein K0R14_632 [Burkholderiales bacterium]|jgi:hypothetical protein|nr:hypothetical protein [Burkholderiales bacterium]